MAYFPESRNRALLSLGAPCLSLPVVLLSSEAVPADSSTRCGLSAPLLHMNGITWSLFFVGLTPSTQRSTRPTQVAVCSCISFTFIVACVCLTFMKKPQLMYPVNCWLMMDRFQFYCEVKCCEYFWACLWCTFLLRVSLGPMLLGMRLPFLKWLQTALQSGGARLTPWSTSESCSCSLSFCRCSFFLVILVASTSVSWWS